MTNATERPSWRKTCSMCGAYYAPYCYGIELMPGSDCELEKPYTTEPDDWCSLWRREPKTEWNGRPCGGTVSETYIRPAEEGPICPIPRASVIFEGQKLTFDDEDSTRFAEIVERHFRKLAGLEDK